MDFSDGELHAAVTAALARHLTHRVPNRPAAATRPASGDGRHPSHALLLVLAGADEDGPCRIEPAVRCDHCGYCQSLGH